MPSASWKYLALLSAALLAVVVFRYAGDRAADHPEALTIGEQVASFKELSDRFAALAKRKGGAYAFEVLGAAELPPNTDLHLLGHVVGDELYAQEGIDGIKVCTQDFRNACSHSIVIGMLNEFGAGESTVEKIRDACTLAPGGVGAYTMCFHGLGHGVFAYFGYDIPKTVAFCERLGTEAHGEGEYTQCVGGMTMELVGGGGHDRDKWVEAQSKYLDANDPLAPCDGPLIPDRTKTFCYMYLTPRLITAAGADLASPDPATFPKAFSFCRAIADGKLRDTCYGSFGKEFIPLAALRDIRDVGAMSDDQFRLAIAWCMQGEREAQGPCVSQELESIFWGGENDPQTAFRFCSLVSDASAQKACYEALANDIAVYVRDPGLHASLCAMLPSSYRAQCEATSNEGI